MATLKELEDALIKADASGNIEDAKIFASEIRKIKNQSTPNVEPTPLSAKEKLEDFVKSTGSGVYKGLSYLPGLPGDLNELGEQLLPKWMTTPLGRGYLEEVRGGPERPKIPFSPTSKNIRGFVEENIPIMQGAGEYVPQTNLGRYTKTGLEFAAPGVAGKTSTARKFGTKLGAGGGLLYQGTEDLTGSSGAASAVTIPAMLTAGLLAGPSKAATLAERSLQNVTEPELISALKTERLANQLGIKLTPGETLNNKTVQSLVDDAIKSDRGAPFIYEATKNRPAQVSSLAEAQANLINPPPTSIRSSYKDIQETAAKSIKDSEILRTSKAYDAGYKVSNTEAITPEQVFSIINQIDDVIKTFPQTSPNINKLNQVKKQLIKKTIKVKGVKEKIIIPETNINKLDSTFKQFRDASKDSKSGMADQRRFIEKDLRNKFFSGDVAQPGILDSLNTQLRTSSNYAKANDVYSQLSRELVEVTERNVLPLAKNNVSPATIEDFVFKPNRNNKADIIATYETLNKTNPNAFPEIANLYFRNAIEKTLISTKQGQDLNQGFNLFASLAKGKNQKENFLTVIEGVAKAKNVDPKALKMGFDNMLRVLERTARLSSMNKPGFDAQGAAARTILKDVAMAKTFNPFVRLATKYGEIKAGGAWESLGRVFASDDAIENLVLLALDDPNSKKAITRVVNITDSIQGYNRPVNNSEERINE